MTVQTLIIKLKKRAWIIILGVVIFGGFSSLQTGKNTSYISSNNLSITLKNYQNQITDSEIKQIGADQAYVGATNFVGLFLTNQLKSVPIQVKIAEKSGLSISSGIEKKPIYTVEDLTGGYVTVINKFDTREKAVTFQKALKTVAKEQIETSYNLNRNSKFVGEIKFFDDSIAEIKTPIELQILIPISISIILLAIVVIIPLKKT